MPNFELPWRLQKRRTCIPCDTNSYTYLFDRRKRECLPKQNLPKRTRKDCIYPSVSKLVVQSVSTVRSYMGKFYNKLELRYIQKKNILLQIYRDIRY